VVLDLDDKCGEIMSELILSDGCERFIEQIMVNTKEAENIGITHGKPEKK
jgi:hypothetical protein